MVFLLVVSTGEGAGAGRTRGGAATATITFSACLFVVMNAAIVEQITDSLPGEL